MGGGRGRGGSPERTIELLWSARADRAAAERAKPGLSVARIVLAAIELADEEGLAALSMRRLAERLGVTSMSLYRHVPGKAELIDLMREALMAEVVAGSAAGPLDAGEAGPGAAAGEDGWRPALAAWARAHWAVHGRHPWLVETNGPRRLPGPNGIATYEAALRAVASTRLRPSELVAVVGLVGGFVDGAARQLAETARVERQTGVSETAWWSARDALYDRLDDAYPTLGRVWAEGGYDDPEDPFEFGLRRVLDGVEALVRARAAEARRAPAATTEASAADTGTGCRDETRDGSRDGMRVGGCAVCGGPVVRSATGRPRAYCSRACQQRAYRRRGTAGPSPTGGPTGGTAQGTTR